MGPRQYDSAAGPLIGVLALVVLVLICRWVFSTGHRDARTAARRAQALSAGDYGLLVQVATTRTAADAAALCEVLADQGIRATVSEGQTPGQQVVLVFRHEAQRARQLVR